MADKKIEDATPDTQVTGVEKMPVSDAGVAKCLTVGQVKDFTIAQITAIASASGIDLSTDGVYLLKGGALKPVASDVLAAAVLDYGFGKVAVASMNGNEIVGVNDAGSQKTITVGQLKTWLEANMAVTADIDIGSKSAAGVLSGEDLLLIAQSGTNKKLTLTNLVGYSHFAFKDYVTSLTAVDNLNNTDVLYVVNGTTAKKCTVAQLRTIIGAGDVIAPTTQTAGNIPSWDNASKKLTDGYGVASQISDTPSTSKLVTEAAVSDAVGTKVDKVTGKGLSENDYSNAEKAKVAALSGAVVLWDSGKAYSVGDYCRHNGKICKCVVANSSVTFDASQWEYIPSYPTSGADTEKFLRQDGTWNVPPQSDDFVGATSGEVPSAGTHGLVPAPTTSDVENFLKGDGTWSDPTSGSAKAPATTTADKIPQWSSLSKTLKDGLTLVKSTDTVPAEADKNTMIPTLFKAQALVETLESAIQQNCVFTNETPTAGTIPLWMTPAEGASQQKKFSGNKAVVTAFGATPSDANIPTEKAVSDHVSLMNGFAKLASETLSNGTSKNLTNHAIHVFGIATGATYTLSVPASAEGRSREFYVTFVQSGTHNATSTVNLSSQTPIHSKSGTITNLSVKKDVSGDSNAYHVYHFFEDAGQIWCVNEFDAAENGASSSGVVSLTGKPVFANEDDIEISAGDSMMLDIKSSANVIPLDFEVGVPSALSLYTFTLCYTNTNGASGFTSSVKVNGANPTLVSLPQGVSTLADLFTGYYGVLVVRVVVEANASMTIVSFSKEASYTPAQ